MKYLKGTHNLGLIYKISEANGCIGFSDSDWAGDLDDIKSTTGYLFQAGGTAVSWRSRKQTCVALSVKNMTLSGVSDIHENDIHNPKGVARGMMNII
uniref:Reverse transcriptase Ty1/copia-type domain-containing protein n=1 Tax=Amphimedon queenslandica TaxID=400682 RepID=A0A1X7TR14_AMPQE